MNSFMVVCLGLYSIGVGVQRPDDRKNAPAAEPAKKANAPAAPMAPIGFPAGIPNAVPGIPGFPGGGVPNGFVPLMPPNGGKPNFGPPMRPMGVAGGPANFPPAMQGFPNMPAREADLPKDLIPTLIESLKDKDKDVRKYVASALARVGREAVEPLIDLLKGKDQAQRANAAYILGQIGGDAQKAMPLLVKALKDDDKEVRLRAAFALERLLAVPRNPMGMGMGGMPMAFNPMTGMMGGQAKKPTVVLPADPGPVAPSAEIIKPAKEPEKKPEKAIEKKQDK